MTTAVKIEMAGHHVLVETIDHYPPGSAPRITDSRVFLPGASRPPIFYATTSRTIQVTDLEPNDPRVKDALLNKVDAE